MLGSPEVPAAEHRGKDGQISFVSELPLILIAKKQSRCDRESGGLAPHRNDFEISMLLHVKEREPDPRRSSGDSRRVRYRNAQARGSAAPRGWSVWALSKNYHPEGQTGAVGNVCIGRDVAQTCTHEGDTSIPKTSIPRVPRSEAAAHSISESVAKRLYPDNDTILEADALHKSTRTEVIRPDLDRNFSRRSQDDRR